MDFEIRRTNLYRSIDMPPSTRTEQRADGDEPSTGSLMFGHFTPFNVWAEIHSYWEGDFLERTVKGAFAKTIAENLPNIRSQFQHGYDPYVGVSPLGPIDALREEDEGPYYEVPLIDTDYNRNRVLPLLQGRLFNGENRGSLLGASYRFEVIKDEWNEEPGVSDHNPKGLPERTISEVRLHEFGPVVWGAFPTATSGVRSTTDHYLALARQRAGQNPADPGAAETGTPDDAADEPARSHSTGNTQARTLQARATTTKLKRRAT